MSHNAFVTSSEEETRGLGLALARYLEAGDIICLIGEIGAGKTRLAQGIGQGLGVADIMTSPTFAFISEYHGHRPLMHADLYRVENEEELEELGLDDYLYGGWVCVVEWADRAPGWMPADRLDILVESSGLNSRVITLCPHGDRYKTLCEVFCQIAIPRN